MSTVFTGTYYTGFAIVSNVAFSAQADGQSTSNANWCDRYRLDYYGWGLIAQTGVTLPAGYQDFCFTYSGGVWTALAGKEAIIAANIAKSKLSPTLSATSNEATLSDGISQVSLNVTIGEVYQATSYEIKYKKALEANYTYKTVTSYGLVVIDGLAISTSYVITVRAITLWGTTDWAASTNIDTAGANPASISFSLQKLDVTGPLMFLYPKNSANPTSASYVYTATLYGGLTTYQWQYWNTSSSAWSNFAGSSTSQTYALAHNDAAWNSNLTLKIRCLSGTSTDEITISKVYDGVDAVTVLSSNEAHTFPADSSGNVSSYANSGTTITVTEGANTIQYDVAGYDAGNPNTWKVSCTGVNITVGTLTDGGTSLVVGTHSGMAANTARIDYQISLRKANGVTFSLTKSQSFSKSIAGATGSPGSPGAPGAPGAPGPPGPMNGTIVNSYGSIGSYPPSSYSGYFYQCNDAVGTTGSGRVYFSDGSQWRLLSGDIYAENIVGTYITGKTIRTNATASNRVAINDPSYPNKMAVFDSSNKVVLLAGGTGGSGSLYISSISNGSDYQPTARIDANTMSSALQVEQGMTNSQGGAIYATSNGMYGIKVICGNEAIWARSTAGYYAIRAHNGSLYSICGGTYENSLGPGETTSVGGVYGGGSTYGVRGNGQYGGYFTADNWISGLGVGVRGSGSGYGGMFYTSGTYGVYSNNSNAGGYGSYNIGGYAGFYAQGTSASSFGTVSDGKYYDFYANGTGINYGPFTGAHDALMFVEEIEELELGDIVCDMEVISKRTISNTIFRVSSSQTAMSKSVVGIAAFILPLDALSIPNALLDTPEILDSGLYQIIAMNALGEGQMNVCKEGGNIEAGDYICSSSTPGKGMKQADDLLHNYTVAKARESVSWSNGDNSIKMIACIYLCG